MYELWNRLYKYTEFSLVFLHTLNVTCFVVYEDDNVFLLYSPVNFFFFKF